MFNVSIQFDDQEQFLAAYFKLTENPIVRTLEVSSDCYIDLDSSGNVVGAELLALEGLKTLQDIAREYRLPALEKVSQKFEPALA